MLQWVFYVLVISVVMSIAGVCAEQALRRRHLPTRQLRRLRHAIEVDCDARVLMAGHNLAACGATLIEVGQRRSRYLGTVAAMSENRTLLEQRIEVMSQRTNNPWKLGFVALFALSLSVALAATQVMSPEEPNMPALKLDTTTLDRYVGYFQIAPTSILTVTREGAQLSAQISGQQPQAGGEAALRKTMNALASGSPNYADMIEPLQNAVRQQKPVMDAFLSKLGAVQTVEFKGVSDAGADKYHVTHQAGKQSQWIIQLAADGRISTLAVLPVF